MKEEDIMKEIMADIKGKHKAVSKNKSELTGAETKYTEN